MSDHASHHRLRSRVISRTHHGVDAIRARYSGSWIQELRAHLEAVQFYERTVVIGAELLWSALPLLILLSSFANERIDDDISRHIGLNPEGARIVHHLFRGHPSHAIEPILTGFIICGAGVISVVQSMQVVYERLYGTEHHGWRDLPRYLAWFAVLLALLVAEATFGTEVHGLAGQIAQAVVTLLVAFAFIGWSIRFLLHGKVSWSDVIPSAAATGFLWLALALFSSAYFSPMVVDDSKNFGAIGVVFSFLTWFILIASVIVIGAALGAVWLNRHERMRA